MVASKSFYKLMAQELEGVGVTGITDPKVAFLKNVWNAEEHYYQVITPYRLAFNHLFPTFNAFIKNQKPGKDGNKAFAATLTRIESYLFNNCIARRVAVELGRTTFLACIFDALVYKQEVRRPYSKSFMRKCMP